MSADVPSAGTIENVSASRFCPELLENAHAIARVLTVALPNAGLVVLDRDLRVVLLCGDVLARRGYSAVDVTGRGLTDAFPATAGAVQAGCRTALTGGCWEGAHQAKHDGSHYRVEVAPVHGEAGDVLGVTIVAQDATPVGRHRAQLDRRVGQQRAVAELGRMAAEGEPLDALRTAAASLVRDAMGADVTTVMQIAPGADTAHVVAGSGWPPGTVGHTELSLDPRCLAGYIAATGRPLLIENLHSDPRFESPTLAGLGMTCGVSVPIGRTGALDGILGAHSATPRRFTSEDVTFMESISALLAGAAARERAAHHAAAAEARFASAFRQAPIGMALFTTHRRPGEPVLTQVNDQLCAMLGYTSEELLALDPVALGHPDELYVGVPEALALVEGRASTYSVEKRLIRSDGSVMHARVQGSLVHQGDRPTEYGICQIEDLTETKRLRAKEDRIWELSVDPLAVLDAEGFLRASPSWERCLGYTPAELAGRALAELVHPADRAATEHALRSLVSTDADDLGRIDDAHFEARTRTKGGHWRWLSWNGRRADGVGPAGAPRSYWVARDITDRLQTQKALTESLRLFDQSFAQAPIGMVISEPGTGRYLRVNDAFCTIVGRTEHELLDGTTFLDITEPDDREEGMRFVAEIEGSAARRATIEKRYQRPDGSSVWASVHATPVRDADGTMTACFAQVVDISAQKARQSELQRKLDDVGWVGRIRDALDNDRFELHAQPIVDLADGTTVQRELLIRMRGADGQLIAPGEFLPAAEEHGMIEAIDRWVLGRSVQIAAAGQAIEVNVSAASMSSPDFLAAVERELAASGADPALLVFEITETALMRQMDMGVAFAERLAGLGCRFALDDFGTGYGSFTYLKRLPVHYLKIDREFVRDVATSPRDRHVVQAIVNLARGFEAQTIAEGVEDAAALEVLRADGVDYAQGYHLGRPAPLDG